MYCMYYLPSLIFKQQDVRYKELILSSYSLIELTLFRTPRLTRPYSYLVRPPPSVGPVQPLLAALVQVYYQAPDLHCRGRRYIGVIKVAQEREMKNSGVRSVHTDC
jgi:hypothetical protein